MENKKLRLRDLNIKTRINFLFLATGLIGLSFSVDAGLFSNKFEAETQAEQVAIKLHNETVEGGYKLIDTQSLKALIDSNKNVLIVDAMPYEASYKAEHIPAATQFEFPIKPMPEWNAESTEGKTQETFARLLGADKSQTLVFYCGFVKCGRSHNAASWAVKMGYTDVYRYPGGIYAWKGAGFNTESD